MRQGVVGEGDEVITTPFSFVAFANCALFERAVPVFVDIDPTSWNMDVSRIEFRITPRTRAILPYTCLAVRAHGTHHAIAAKYGLTVIEDSCRLSRHLQRQGGRHIRPDGDLCLLSLTSKSPR